MPARDPGALPGLSAAELQGRARVALAAGVIALLVVAAFLGFGARPSVLEAVLLLAPAFAGFVAWLVLGGLAGRRMRAERDAGYSTVLDVPGFALRDGRTGELRRAADQPPIAAEPAGPLVMRMFRIRPGSWLAPRSESPSSPESSQHPEPPRPE